MSAPHQEDVRRPGTCYWCDAAWPHTDEKPKVKRTEKGVWYVTFGGETFASLAWSWLDALAFALAVPESTAHMKGTK